MLCIRRKFHLTTPEAREEARFGCLGLGSEIGRFEAGKREIEQHRLGRNGLRRGREIDHLGLCVGRIPALEVG